MRRTYIGDCPSAAGRAGWLRHWTAFSLVGALLASGCGGERQDENEPSGDFPVEVVSAEFPEDQKLAQSSRLLITVRNAGDETIPNIGASVEGFQYRVEDDPTLADPSRPVFAVNGDPVQIARFPEAKDATPRGCDTAYAATWACGPLRPGEEKTLRWAVTAVRAGRFELEWQVNAGLDGDARAVTAGGRAPAGSFKGTVSDVAPRARIGDDGETVITESP